MPSTVTSSAARKILCGFWSRERLGLAGLEDQGRMACSIPALAVCRVSNHKGQLLLEGRVPRRTVRSTTTNQYRSQIWSGAYLNKTNTDRATGAKPRRMPTFCQRPSEKNILNPSTSHSMKGASVIANVGVKISGTANSRRISWGILTWSSAKIAVRFLLALAKVIRASSRILRATTAAMSNPPLMIKPLMKCQRNKKTQTLTLRTTLHTVPILSWKK